MNYTLLLILTDNLIPTNSDYFEVFAVSIFTML